MANKQHINDPVVENVPPQYKKIVRDTQSDDSGEQPLNVDHNNGQDDGSNWGEELQNQDDSSDDSSDDAQDGEER